MSARQLVSALALLGVSLTACIDSPEFRQVDTSATEPASSGLAAPSATPSGSAAPPVDSGKSDDDDDDDDDVKPTPPSPPQPGPDAGSLCGGKTCKADQMCCENKCKGGPKC